MPQKDVTTAQLEDIRKVAREKGVDRVGFQRALDAGVFSRALDETREMMEGLEFVRTIEVHGRDTPFHPDTDFCGDHLWFSSAMKDLVRRVKPIDSAPATTLPLCRLKRRLNDAEIVNAAGGRNKHVFRDPGVFLALLDQILRRQAKGPEGEEQLLPTNTWIIFHVEVDGGFLAVDVHWGSILREWGVHCRRLDDDRWREGGCAVSSNC